MGYSPTRFWGYIVTSKFWRIIKEGRDEGGETLDRGLCFLIIL